MKDCTGASLMKIMMMTFCGERAGCLGLHNGDDNDCYEDNNLRVERAGCVVLEPQHQLRSVIDDQGFYLKGNPQVIMTMKAIMTMMMMVSVMIEIYFSAR